jgi:hypothetical protein
MKGMPDGKGTPAQLRSSRTGMTTPIELSASFDFLQVFFESHGRATIINQCSIPGGCVAFVWYWF